MPCVIDGSRSWWWLQDVFQDTLRNTLQDTLQDTLHDVWSLHRAKAVALVETSIVMFGRNNGDAKGGKTNSKRA